jgi:hypothetical protein
MASKLSCVKKKQAPKPDTIGLLRDCHDDQLLAPVDYGKNMSHKCCTTDYFTALLIPLTYF